MQTSAKHTPGPWAWNESRSWLRAALPDPSTSAVHTILESWGYRGYLSSTCEATHIEGEANLTLIGAAPQVAKALIAEVTGLRRTEER